MRARGLESCFVNEDWIAANCKNEIIDIHRAYLVEYAREELTCADPSKIIYSDELNCQSSLLNELKGQRLANWGRVDDLMASPHTSHLAQLDPALRSMLAYDNLASKKWRSGEFVIRRQKEMDLYSIEPREPWQRIGIAQEVRTAVMRSIMEALPFMREWISIDVEAGLRTHPSLCMKDREGGALVIRGLVQFDTELDVWEGGSIGMALFFANSDHLNPMHCTISDRCLIPLRLHALLPSNFSGIGRFEGIAEFNCAFESWKIALKVCMQEILRLELSA
jgi:hypothetical protein